MNKKVIKGDLFDAVVWSENKHNWALLLFDDSENIIAHFRVSKESRTVFQFTPIDYTYENHKLYAESIKEIIKGLK